MNLGSSVLCSGDLASCNKNTCCEANSYTCQWPTGASSYSLITEGDAKVYSHDIYTGLAIGGTLSDGTPQDSGDVMGNSIVGALAGGGRINFKGSLSYGALPFDWSHFEWLARNIKDVRSTYFVCVFTSGGTYNCDDCRYGSDGNDHGMTLMVFNTADPINLVDCGPGGGRQFGPSLLAPFSTVTLQGRAGYADGTIIAKEFGPSSTYPTVSSPTQLQLHGDFYQGPLTCT